jgi:hypothetical protein
MKKLSWVVAAALALPLAAAVAPTALEAASEHEVTVTINKVKALDRADVYSQGDFYARVTIDGDVQNTQSIKQDGEISPNWKVTKKVKAGEVKVKIEILDKDVSKDDPIDINRVSQKRDLDFTVDTKKCRVNGLASTVKCGRSITRAGGEEKKAQLTFTVTVKK